MPIHGTSFRGLSISNLAAEQSCNTDYTYFIHLTLKYSAAHFVFNYLLIVASSERTSLRNASVTVGD
jgi:hypothetical protein